MKAAAGNKKIAFFFATSGHSGVDRIMGNLIPAVAERGYPVDLLRIRGHGPFLDPVPEGIRVVDLRTAHVNSSLQPLMGYLRNEQPLVVLSDKDRVNRTLLLARKLSGANVRAVIRVGTTVSENLKRRGWWHRWFQYFSIRRIYPWADAIVVPSRGAAEDLKKIGRLPSHQVRVTPSPVVRPDLFSMAQEPLAHPWFHAGTVPVILGVGELCARKDFQTLIKAVALVKKKRPCRLVILGKGRQKDKLKQMASDLGISKDVYMPGFVANPYPFMAACSVFVLSSRCEGAPVVLIEAMALGKTMVATDCPSGPSEILEKGRYGRLVPVGEPEAMAKAIEESLSSPQDPEVAARAARPYHVEASTDAYLEVLIDAFHATGGSGAVAAADG